MGLENTTFNLYTDSGLTTPYSGTSGLTHNTSLSDNPQDFTFYLGSVSATDTQLRASSNPGVANITLTPTDVLPEWAVATAYTLGQNVEPTSGNGYRYECTTAGTSHATTEPTWPVIIGSTVSDNGTVWTCASLSHQTTEIKLALSSGALGAATPGAALSVGSTILSGVAGAVPVYMRVTNAITTVGSAGAQAEIDIYINAVQEDAA